MILIYFEFYFKSEFTLNLILKSCLFHSVSNFKHTHTHTLASVSPCFFHFASLILPFSLYLFHYAFLTLSLSSCLFHLASFHLTSFAMSLSPFLFHFTPSTLSLSLCLQFHAHLSFHNFRTNQTNKQTNVSTNFANIKIVLKCSNKSFQMSSKL